jgi:hypothetical protein
MYEYIIKPMSEEFVNKVTLEYLVNKDYNVTVKTSKVDKRDKKFYRKRIFNLTKEILSNEEPADVLPDVKYAFDNYVKHCINYFKAIDCSDILQEDYKDMSMNNLCNATELLESNQIQEDANKLIMRSVNIQSSTLDKFIKRTVKKETVVLPQQKEVDLKNPELKLKGVKKKKNITNKYEEIVENKKQEDQTKDKTKNKE